MNRITERRLLQLAVAVACLVPLTAGAAGVVRGTGMIAGIGAAGAPDLESHFRYLSGVLLGIGLAFAAGIPTIERRSELFLALTGIVVLGGLARLAALLNGEAPSTPHVLALGMELVVVPLIFLWQRRVSRRFAV